MGVVGTQGIDIVGTTASALSSFCMPNFNQGLADFTELSKLDARTVSMSALCTDWDSPRADCNAQYKMYLSMILRDRWKRRKVTCIPNKILSGFDPFAQARR